MKGLDTPALLALLEGSPRGRRLLRSLGGEELATTEVNLFELAALAREDRTAGRERRLQALARLRRKLTVLPIDENASERAALLASHAPSRAPEVAWLAFAAAETHGCGEWITTRAGALPRVTSKTRQVIIDR